MSHNAAGDPAHDAGGLMESKHRVKIGGVHCSFCSSTISKGLSAVPGITRVSVNIGHEEALIHYDPAKVQPWQIDEELRELGYTVRDPDKVRTFEEEESELAREQGKLTLSTVLTFSAIAVMALMYFHIIEMYVAAYSVLSFAVVNVFWFGRTILKSAAYSLRRKILNQHVLMEFAAFGGLAGGFLGLFVFRGFPAVEFFAIAVFITSYHILGGYASLRVRTHSSQAVRKLLSLQPDVAHLAGKDGTETAVPVERVNAGDLVRIRPGESIPVDGTVVEGQSTVDESLVTGESVPSEKYIGSEVIGGTLNGNGTLLVRVTRIGKESFLQQVAEYIEDARSMKPGILQLLDKVLQYFVPGVLIAAVAGFIIWSLGEWLFTGAPDFYRAVFAALAVLVMGYPCALGMSTPLAMMRGSTMAAERGILFRSADAFHVFHNIDTVVLDKTGTLTEGRPDVSSILCRPGYDEKTVLTIAGALERYSEHPYAKAIVRKAKEHAQETTAAENFSAVPGKGVTGTIEGKSAAVGTVDFLLESGSRLPNELRLGSPVHADGGETVVGVAYDGDIIGLITLSDKIKDDATSTIAILKDRYHLRTMMITGDGYSQASRVARKTGVDMFFASVLPNGKAEKIRELQSQGHRVLMVGDGINDAPSLMQADIGVALGSGTDIAIEAADVVIVGRSLGAVAEAYSIGLKSYGKTKQNLAIAFSFNGVGIPVAATGLIDPIWAMVAMALSVTAVLANSFIGTLFVRAGERADRAASVHTVSLDVPWADSESSLERVVDMVSDLDGVLSVSGSIDRRELTVRYEDGDGRSIEQRISSAVDNRNY